MIESFLLIYFLPPPYLLGSPHNSSYGTPSASAILLRIRAAYLYAALRGLYSWPQRSLKSLFNATAIAIFMRWLWHWPLITRVIAADETPRSLAMDARAMSWRKNNVLIRRYVFLLSWVKGLMFIELL